MRVRQALSEAVNRQAIVNSLYGGTGLLAKEFLAPGMLGYNEDIQAIPYDPAHAKQLLSRRGHAERVLHGVLVHAGRPAVLPESAGDRAGGLQRLGAGGRQVRPEDEGLDRLPGRRPTPQAGRLDGRLDRRQRRPGQLPVLLLRHQTRPAVANNNTWDNPQVRDLLLQAQRSVDDGQRDALYKQVATIVRGETPKIPMAHTTPPLFAQSYVQGYVTNPTATELFNTITLDGKP